MTIKYIDLFAGLGGFRSSLDKFGFQCVLSSEIDKHANKAYEVLYGEKTAGDVTKIDEKDVPEHDLLVAGFPCPAYSVAGARAGMEYECEDCGHEHLITYNDYKNGVSCPVCGGITKPKDDRGVLFFEIARIAESKKPRLLLLENVKGLLSSAKGEVIRIMLETLSEIGYMVDFKVLNSKYFGVAQNRERVFIVGILGGKTEPYAVSGNNVLAKTKKRMNALNNINTFNFQWPTNNKVTTKLADILEENPDEKYYLSDEKTAKLLARLEEENKTQEKAVEDIKVVGLLDMKANETTRRVDSPAGIAPTLTTMGGGHREPKIVVVGNTNPSKSGMNGQVYDIEGLSPTITTNKGEGVKILENKIEVRPVLTPERIEKRQNGRRFKEDGEPSFTLTAIDRHGVAIGNPPKYRIRKLTPLECLRLQSFPDEYYHKLISANISNSQLYKMAGNAVTVNVVYEIIKELIKWQQ